MSNELTINAAGDDLAVYAVVRRRNDAYVWSTASDSFTPWIDANLGDYSIALASAGGDLYTSDMPASLPAGSAIRITYYRQLADDPASDDLLLASVERQWNGVALASDEPAQLSAYALTTLARVKQQLRIDADDASQDDLLVELINAASLRIERWCGRQFKARSHRHWLIPHRGTLRLPHYPLLEVTRVVRGTAAALSVTHTGSAIAATVAVQADADTGGSGGLQLTSIDASGAVTTANLDFADYPTTSLLADAINARAGWSATLLNNQPSELLHPAAGVNALGAAAVLTWPDNANAAWHADFDRGTLRLLGGVDHPTIADCVSNERVLVEYRAGYESIPADLQQLCARMVAISYHARSSTPPLRSETLGDWSYTLATTVELANEFEDQLAPWREVR